MTDYSGTGYSGLSTSTVPDPELPSPIELWREKATQYDYYGYGKDNVWTFPIIAHIIENFTGSRKSGALSVICEALKKIPVDEDALPISQTSTPSNSHRNVATKRLFVNNETITTAKLHEELVVNDGVYLSLLDEIDWLFDAVDGRNRPDGIDRRMWLSLYGGSSKGRNTARSSSIIDETRLNYTGKPLICSAGGSK